MPHFDELPAMSADVRRLNGLDTPAARPQGAPKRARRTLAQIGADDAPQHDGSALEQVFIALLASAAPDLCWYQREYIFFAPWRQWRFDFAWISPSGIVAVECDGGQYAPGGGRHNTDGDREKLNTAAALGWRVLRFSGAMLNNEGAACIALLRRALER